MKKVVVLHDEVAPGAPADARDNLVQAQAVAGALAGLGHRVVSLALGLDLAAAAAELSRIGPDIVFNLVESVDGRMSLIHLAPSLLASRGFSFTGAGDAAMFESSRKTSAKAVFRAAGLPSPEWLSPRDLAGRTGALQGRWIVKSVWEHASVGLSPGSVLENPTPAELRALFADRAARWGGDWFAERFVEGREFNLSILAGPGGAQVLPPAEILFEGFGPGAPRIVDWAAKWDEASHAYHNTPRSFDFPEPDRFLLAELSRLALAAWSAFSLRGWARVDFRVDETGNPWILEVNANPCLSPDAGFAAAAERAGIGFDEVIRSILADATPAGGGF